MADFKSAWRAQIELDADSGLDTLSPIVGSYRSQRAISTALQKVCPVPNIIDAMMRR